MCVCDNDPCDQQKSDAGGDDVEIPVENEAFMDDFFAQVWNFICINV